jgi:hypothetical protein
LTSHLQAVVDDLRGARLRLDTLVQRVPDDWWGRRPAPDRWSVAECIAHLNLTSAAFLPRIREALAVPRRLDGHAPRRYRRDPIGWILWKVMGPTVRLRLRTPATFVPTRSDAPHVLADTFARLQDEQIACVRDAEGLPLDRITIASPFDARVKYNLYSCLTILPRHQHRHLSQAEQAWRELQRR